MLDRGYIKIINGDYTAAAGKRREILYKLSGRKGMGQVL
jgi:hypothetical protein